MSSGSDNSALGLYPLKFRPLLKEKIWGGNRLARMFGQSEDSKIGESWLLSGLADDQTVVINGYLADNTIDELVEVYMGELVGDKVYEQYGDRFPLLFKIIDADDNLSVQVHPDDDYAERHGLESGKTEMWYVMHSDDGGIIYGLDYALSTDELKESLSGHTLLAKLHHERVSKGDCVLINGGTIHSLGKGVMVAEIQQSSNDTFRLYDYDRRDSNGQTRELHIKEAMEVADLQPVGSALIDYHAKENGAANICRTPYFTVNTLQFSRTVARDYATLDSFVALLCVEGSADIQTTESVTAISYGELVLLPASLNDVAFSPTSKECKLLEVYIE